MPELRNASHASPIEEVVAWPQRGLAVRVLKKFVCTLSLIFAGPATLALVLLMISMLRDWQGAAGSAAASGTFPLLATFSAVFLSSVSLGIAGFVALSSGRPWIGLSIAAWSFWLGVVVIVGIVYVRETYPATFDPAMFVLLVLLAIPAFPAITGSCVAHRLSRRRTDELSESAAAGVR